MTLVERLHWILRMSLLLFILASVAFLSALTAMRYAVHGREVVVPDVVGQTTDVAGQILQARGVGIKVEDRLYSNSPVDVVVRQSPPPNTTIKIGQFEHVVLSLGPQKATIPQLEDKSLRAARIELLRNGLQAGEISSVYLPGSEDIVMQQDPMPGTTDVTSPHVNFLVSLGPRPAAYVMPDLVGFPISDAQSKLGSVGLKVSKFTPITAPGAPHGIVVGQTPSRGQRVDPTMNIELRIGE